MRLCIKSDINELQNIYEKVNFFCAKQLLSPSVINLVLDEMLSNIIKYSLASKTSKITTDIIRYSKIIEIQILYKGTYFNINKYQPQKKQTNGNVGILITRSFAKNIFYKRSRKYNILTIFLDLTDII